MEHGDEPVRCVLSRGGVVWLDAEFFDDGRPRQVVRLAMDEVHEAAAFKGLNVLTACLAEILESLHKAKEGGA